MKRRDRTYETLKGTFGMTISGGRGGKLGPPKEIEAQAIPRV